jgi:hypothetical protein
MKGFLLFSFSVVSFIGSFGQKIQGSYVGNILSDRSILLLDMDKNAQVTGTLYLNRNEHFNFKGTYTKPQLRGLIAIDASKSISIEGNLKGNSLRITCTDSVRKRMYLAHKILPKVSVDIDELYSDEHDMLLLGQWITFKKTDGYGNNIDEQRITTTYDFGFRGRGTVSLDGLPAVIATSRGIASTSGIPPPNWEIDWETKKGILYVTNRPFNLSVLNVYDYYIRNDTLITKLHSNGNTELLKRK